MLIIPLIFVCVTYSFPFLKTSYFKVNSLYCPLSLQCCLNIFSFFFFLSLYFCHSGFQYSFSLRDFIVGLISSVLTPWVDLFCFDSCFYPFSPFFSSFCKYAISSGVLGCGMLFHHYSWGFVFCSLKPIKNSWPHEKLIHESPPKSLHLNTKNKPQQKASKFQYQMPHTKTSAK